MPARRNQQRQRPTTSTAAADPDRFGPNVERGQTRSGARFAARNLAYYTSIRELLRHHQRLLSVEPAVTTQYAHVGRSRGTLLQTTVRFRADSQHIRRDLRQVFLDLFRQHTDGGSGGFEVVTTFNVILSNSTSTTFSLFYGHDYRSTGQEARGAREGLVYGSSTTVTSPDDVDRLPTSFDFERLVHEHRNAFDSSDVRVVRFINVVYLIYQFRHGTRGPPP